MVYWAQLSDEVLAELLLTNNSAKALSILYERYFNKLVYFSYKYVQEQSQAEDIVQDVFLQLIRKITQFDTSRTFSTWIYTLVKNHSLNVLQTQQRQHSLLMQHVSSTVNATMHQTIDAQQLQKAMQQVLQTLNEKEQLVYTLRIEQELSIREVAAIADIPEGSVKSCLYYVLKKIANHLKELIHE